MKITALGTGGMYCLNNFHTNFVLHNKDSSRFLLIDCGTDIRFSLAALRLSYEAIDAVYVTHMHPDHVGGLPWLAFKSLSGNRESRIKLFVHTTLVPQIEAHLAAATGVYDRKRRTLVDYFDLITMGSMSHLMWQNNIGLSTYPWVHCNGGEDVLPMLSHGLTIDEPDYGDTTYNRRIHYGGDLNNSEVVNVPSFLAEHRIDLMLMDCYTGVPYPGDQVHPRYTDLLALEKADRAKLALVHYQDNIMIPAENSGTGHPQVQRNWEREAMREGFYGFLPPHGVVNTETLVVSKQV